jgi:serine protease Do
MKRWSLALVCVAAVALSGTYFVGSRLLSQQPPPAVMLKELYSYRDIVKRVLPAVVSIEAEAKVKPKNKLKAPGNKRMPRFDDPRIPEEFRKFFEDFGGPSGPFDQMPDESPRLGFGSGFLIDAKGVILTNWHVVDGADHVTVHLKDGRKFTSRDIKGDRKTDLAIVRIDPKDQGPLPFLDLGDSEAMEIGDRVLAVGAPFGLTGTVTQGIVSAKGRNGLQMNMYEDFIQTDAAINPGNSGGPLINLEGKVIGINSAIKSRSGGFQGIGLAVASNLARTIVQSLQKEGVVHRGYLGVQITDLAPEVATRLGLTKDSGVVVGDVFDGSPAANGGLQAGDVITSIGSHPVKDGRQLQTIVAGLPLRKPVDVTVLRDGKSRVLSITIEEQPNEFGTATAPAPRRPQENPETIPLEKAGMEIADLTPEMIDELGFRKNLKGAVITSVDPGSPAHEAGLRKGMVISKVDQHVVATAQAVRRALNAANLERGALLQVQSPRGGTNFVLLKVEPVAAK